MFGHVSNPFTCCTLNVWLKGALITIWVGQTAQAMGSTTTPMSGSPIQKQGAPMASVVVVLRAMVTISSVLTAAALRVVVVAQPVGPARVVIIAQPISPREPLNLGEVSVECAA